jgi:hypothetical protein
MRYVKGQCRKCGTTIKLDLGALTPAEAHAALEMRASFHCPGNHVELAGPLKYWEIDWETVHEDDTTMPTDDEWLVEKHRQYEIVVDTRGLSEVIDRVVGFAMGACIVERKGCEEQVEFERSPLGTRYYLIGPRSTRVVRS